MSDGEICWIFHNKYPFKVCIDCASFVRLYIAYWVQETNLCTLTGHNVQIRVRLAQSIITNKLL